ncbi:MAG: ABC transporter permease [Clostridia bacterium]|nr:ABC transporter permease [Clostridia bacterium]
MKNKQLYSPEHRDFLQKTRREKTVVRVWQISILIGIIALWEGLGALGVINTFIMSSPSRIMSTLGDLLVNGDLLYHTAITLFETIVGFVIATVLGTIIAILLWWSERLRKILDPYIVVLNSLPKIALGPIIIIWVGAGIQSIVTICVLILIIVTIISMLNAFRECDPDKIMLMRSMGANTWQILTKLVLPSSIPQFISVLKINVGLSWVGTIMGEYLVSSAGLGYLIVYGSQVFQLDLVMASTMVLCVLASIMYLAVALLEKKILKSRH